MKPKSGFTLVELLVVIAIIAILAGIVIPNVPKYINKARATRAFAEIKGIDLATTKMLTDVNRTDFKSGFFDAWPAGGNLVDQLEMYQTTFYLLLRKGKYADSDVEWNSGIALNPEVKRKLGDSYMDLQKDPWGNLYYVVPGPFNYPEYRNTDGQYSVQFRIYQPDLSVPGGVTSDVSWNVDGVTLVTDPDDPNAEQFNVGYPASRKQITYVWSTGKNRRSNQQFDDGYDPSVDAAEVGLDFKGGGDDINNWDGDSSWVTFYN
ncbi:MAG: prepilin-type N-terminal cleavage/methylation domain-containing protein [Candidatus Hydrogenedentes bacterium]|nr:prepilin-type N-terminal cleavage/methylation domain-containing protein [Candidatus Hydrogenedentota bacterium]